MAAGSPLPYPGEARGGERSTRRARPRARTPLEASISRGCRQRGKRYLSAAHRRVRARRRSLDPRPLRRWPADTRAAPAGQAGAAGVLRVLLVVPARCLEAAAAKPCWCWPRELVAAELLPSASASSACWCERQSRRARSRSSRNAEEVNINVIRAAQPPNRASSNALVLRYAPHVVSMHTIGRC